MNQIILSFHDAIIYQEDLKILKTETEWLNDRVISFYFEYLSKEVYEDEKILFIGKLKFNRFKNYLLLKFLKGPEVTQAIKIMGNPGEVKMIFLDPLNATSRNFIIFAVNDNTANAAGGSHWSLCVWSKNENTFFHFDSSSGSNSSSCSKLVKILKSCLNCKTAELNNVQCLQQNNCYDCGIFVLCHADIVCQTAMKEGNLRNVKKLQPQKVHLKRNEIVQIIQNLAAANS